MKHYNFNELTKNDFDEITIFTPDGDDLEGKFTNIRIDRNTIPEGMYAYDLREGDNGEFCTIEKNVMVNHGGTIILEKELNFGEEDYLLLDDAPGNYGYSF